MTIWYAGAYAPAYQMVIHVEIDKYTKNKLCTKLVLFTRLYSDAWSTKQKTSLHGQQNKKLPCMVNKTKNFLAWSTKQKTSLHGQHNKKLPCMVNKTKNFLAWSTKQKTSLHGQQNKKIPCMVNKTENFLPNSLKSINHNKPSIQWYTTNEAEGALPNKPQTNTSHRTDTKLTTR